MDINNIKSWADMIEYIVEDNPSKSHEKIIAELDISSKWFYEIKNGRVIPKDEARRKLEAYMKEKYGMKVDEVSGGHQIQIVKTMKVQNFNNYGGHTDEDLERKDIDEVKKKKEDKAEHVFFLVNQMMELKQENDDLRLLVESQTKKLDKLRDENAFLKAELDKCRRQLN